MNPRYRSGLTVIELVVVLIIVGVLAALAISAYRAYFERARVAEARNDIQNIQIRAAQFTNEYGNPPMNLGQVGMATLQDPWGNPYQFLNINDPAPGTNGNRRKDRNLVPINSDYDLYSMGPDGDSQPPLTNPESHDDIIRARDGAFIGVAKDF